MEKEMVGFVFARDDKVAELLRNATAFRDKKEWDAAINTLAEAKKLMLISPVLYPTETWCKYPLYLQFAGRWDEALVEFEFLLDLNKRKSRHKIDRRCVKRKMGLAFSRMKTKEG